MTLRRLVSVASAIAFVCAALAVAPSRAAGHELTQGCVESVPEPGSETPVSICYTLYKPAGASAANRVPMVLHSHGWGGSRTNSDSAFGVWLDNGFGVLSFDQRGFGESGGKAHVENPDFEGQDVQRIVDLVAGLDWVATDRPGDPVLGAIGGSYGGGYQFVGAFTELRDRGATRFDALAPEITWWDLPDSLAPSGVARTAWVTALYAAGADAHTDTVHKGFAYGAATGNWPNDAVADAGGFNLDEFFGRNGPAWHVSEGRRLDIPVLFRQGLTDNLFNLNQGVHNMEKALTPGARARSIFVGYNGGHALPTVLPPGVGSGADPCSAALTGGKSFTDLTLAFFTEALKKRAAGVPDEARGRYHLSTPDGACVTSPTPNPTTTFAVAPTITTAGVGGPQYVKVVDGPITVAGVPDVTAAVTSVGVDARAFFALAVGTSPSDAKVIQHNMLPLREPVPVTSVERIIELPGVAVDVPEGQSLFLVVSPVSDISFGHGSRTPGVLQLDTVNVHLPVVASRSSAS